MLIEDVFETAYGDSNLDGLVDVDDFLVIVNHWRDEGGWAVGDNDGSGVIGKGDLALFNANYGFGYANGLDPIDVVIGGITYRVGGTSSVPEPAALTLLAAAGLTLLRRRR